jgi:thiamine-phosphate pyrophosphorylase
VGGSVTDLARGGVPIVQLRAKGVDDRRHLEWAREARDAARAAGVLFLVNDRPDIARMVGADGVHIGQEDLPPDVVRKLLPAGAIVGLSTHTVAQLEVAATQPVDYVAVGPVFATRSKLDHDPVVGVEMIRLARRLVSKPLVAIGGITRANVREVSEAGADGVAVISELLLSQDLETASRLLRAALEEAG